MSALVKEMVSVRIAPWHLGVETTEKETHVVPDYLGREAMMKLAGHDFTIVEKPVAVDGVTVEEWKALVRSDNGVPLDIADKSYTVIQNSVGWDVVDAIVNEPKVKYETAGILSKGATCWVLAWLDEPAQVPGDPSPLYPFVLVSWAHDGTSALKASATSVRVVCWNTINAAWAQGRRAGRDYTFRHTAKVMDRLAEAKTVLTGVRKEHAAFLELAHDLANQKVSAKDIERFTVEFIPMPADALISDRVKQHVLDGRDQFKAILSGPTCEGINGTKYGLFQGGIEFTDYGRRANTKESLFRRTMLAPHPAKTKVLDLVRSI